MHVVDSRYSTEASCTYAENAYDVLQLRGAMAMDSLSRPRSTLDGCIRGNFSLHISKSHVRPIVDNSNSRVIPKVSAILVY